MYGQLVRVMHQTYVNGLSLVGNRLLDLRLTPLLRKQVSRSDGKHLLKAWNEATCVWERECEGDARCRGRGGVNPAAARAVPPRARLRCAMPSATSSNDLFIIFGECELVMRQSERICVLSIQIEQVGSKKLAPFSALVDGTTGLPVTMDNLYV